MSLDLLDAAFVRRLSAQPQRGRREPTPPAQRPQHAAPAAAVIPAPRPVTPVARPAPQPAPTPLVVEATPRSEPVRAEQPHEDPLVGRLLARASEEWDALAGHVEAARQRGRRVIAVAGGRAGEGRTTLLACLAKRLRARGRDVVCTAPHDLAHVAAGPEGRGPTHDKRIILVDAGVWFPPGPIRRAWLQVASLGCEAAILVRRAGASGGLARQAALEGLGIEVLGEVLTFTSPLVADDTRHGGTAA